MVWYAHLFQNFLQFVVIHTIVWINKTCVITQFLVIHTVKGFRVVDEAEGDFFFLEFSYFFYDPMDNGNLISGSLYGK